MKNMESAPVRQPDRVLSYFENQRPVLAVVTVSGLIYNLGLVVGPWFEGQLAQCLLGILNGNETFAAMAALCAGYLIAIAVVQGSRFIKRLYVRKFANNINRSMKQVLYANLVRKDKVELEQAGTGTLMTKAISDVDACAEGMRKFTTEIFDTGIALLAYAVMLLGYDWRLALLCLVFAPISYYIAEQMKTLVQRTGAANKESTGRLSAATLDRVSGALTYRVYGCEPQRDAAYEACLQDYERTAVKAGLPVAAMPPLYGVSWMTGVLFIFTFGARNVAGTGWAAWDIAAFTTFLSCFGKLAVKSSHAAKLFNAVQKAQVSWGRIKPLMRQPDPLPEEIPAKPETLTVNKLGFAYRGGAPVLQDITFTAQPGRIFGITGAVACGKSTLGKAFLCEQPYGGSIRLDLPLAGEMEYYNGLIFQGYLRPLPRPLLKGGRYDLLMQKFTPGAGAIGFAVYLDELDRLSAPLPPVQKNSTDKVMLNVALPKGRLGDKVYNLLAGIGYGCPEDYNATRKLVVENPEAGIRYFLVKPSDVAIYVEHGAADVGIVGKDILTESGADVYELLDTGLGRCRMCVAAPADYKDDPSRPVRVATKFVNIAKSYYASIGRDIDIIKLNGSIELAPILGLSDVIVDIVETGTTLRENGLRVVTEFMPISARFIANKASYQFKHREMDEMLEKLRAALAAKEEKK